METQGGRIKNIRTALNLSQEDFGNIFSISKQCVYSLEKDLSSLNNEKLVKLLVDYNVNANYLLAGIGEMFISPKDDSYTNMRDSILSDVRKMLKEEGII